MLLGIRKIIGSAEFVPQSAVGHRDAAIYSFTE